MPRRPGLLLLALCCLAPLPGLLTGPARAQAPASPVPAPPAPASSAAAEPAPPPARIGDPWDAYAAGLYDQALEGFVDRQVERPEDPALALSVGSAHYKMRDYEEADRAFAAAAASGEPALRAEALYNLGNSAYRQGRLEEAVELYKAALEIDPGDQDAKFNLEFVRDEIRRRHEEAQKRQEQQQQQQQEEQGQKEGQQQQEQEPGEEQEQDGEQEQPREQPEDGSEPGEQPPATGPDSDRDGLSDELERTAENPTDPSNPDTDSDGLADGQEDLDRDGRVDEGETDPNRPDTDGDGIPDGQEAAAAGGAPPDPGDETAGMTPEQAERYLQALEEGQPARRKPQRGRRRPEKDW